MFSRENAASTLFIAYRAHCPIPRRIRPQESGGMVDPLDCRKAVSKRDL
jgi:hypothetical protein